MEITLLNGVGPLLLLVSGVGLSLGLLVSPLFRPYPDDQGDGLAVVLLPAPRLPAMWRAPMLAVLFTALTVLYHGVTGPRSPDGLYRDLVLRLSESVVHAPTELAGYLENFQLSVRFLIVATMISLAVLARGTFLRRLAIAGQALCYLATMAVVDALLTVTEVLFAFPVGPSTLLGNFVAITVGFVGMARLLYANFALPRPSAVPFAPRRRSADAVTLVALTVAGMALPTGALLLAYQRADSSLRPVLAVVAPVPFAYGALICRSLFLWLLGRLTLPPEPAVTEERPAMEVITPAYNEEEAIVATLEAVDRAARRYGGSINIIVANDSSTDRTAQLAEGAMSRLTYATGRVINVRHGGKSATLNAALNETTADLLVRIDADTLVDESCFYYAHRWFRDPEIGLVEAMMFPKWRRSPFPRMRLFEELRQFGFIHRTIQQVDGVNVVPGVFTAFRREAAIELGGFTAGMNGEDGDFTLRCSRLGYRSHLDANVIVHEDVPPTYRGIREQRVRWDRATIHNNARHGPYRAGMATPKVWFSHLHQFFERMFSPIRITLPLYLLCSAAFQGAYRYPVLLFFSGWFVATVTFMAMETALAVAYRHQRRLGWLLVWPLWQLCLTVFSVEAWLSLPGRPVKMWRSEVSVISEAVVH
ncbi:MAG: glycosyltransferase family 2 protein [Actinomycetota bacterium]|nr:glycosyltransferase family 2 protein [Actinomycetota bacterium]